MDCEKIRFYPSKKQQNITVYQTSCSRNFQPPLADSKLMVLKQPEQEMKLMFPEQQPTDQETEREGEKWLILICDHTQTFNVFWRT